MKPDPILVRRRSFLAGLGLTAGGLAVGLFGCSNDPASGEIAPVTDELPRAGAGGDGLRPSAFIHVAPGGIVTIVCKRSEMGQGIRSTLPVLVAEELGADMGRVKILQADGDKAYGDQNTDGSNSIRSEYEEIRRIGATARVLLIAAAAKKWGVKPATCKARDHAVVHEASKRSLSFGDLANDAAKLPIPKPADVELRPAAELRRIGGPLPLLDGPAIVMGQAAFGADVKLPGMLIAVIARPPVVGGKVKTFDAKKALAVPGVKKVIELPAATAPFAFKALGGVAVLAENTWAALRGRAALEIAWDDGENASYDSGPFKDALLKAVRAPGKAVREVGDVDRALGSAKKTIEAEYYVPHLAHAAMEPPAVLARMDGDACEVWAPTQNPQAARTEAARTLGVDEKKVTVHVTFLGGGFGRKSKADFVSEAVFLARAAGAPVRVQWTREDDVRHDYYHAVSAQRLTAGLDAEGKVIAWRHRTAFPPIPSTFSDTSTPSSMELTLGATDLPLAAPNVRVEACDAKARVRIGWLRSVCNIFHAFAVGSFIDEIAHARGKDTRDVLLEVVGPPRVASLKELGIGKIENYGASLDKHPIDTGRLHRVVDRVTELSKWSSRKADGRSLGLYAHRSFLTYVAVVASVVRDARGKIRVDEAWIVADAGTIINMDRVRAQLEGAVVFGMSIALHGAITLKGGAVEQSNFRDYRVARIGEVPQGIHVEVMPSTAPPGGVGEPGVPPVAPAIANAVFALTGQRVRELPLAKAGLV